ncbi:MAG: ABC transporter ATP-binding protein [Armatimonadetes bacterium]|nr:ABC transporter ATP-binding protein [Armatimonadota bacterium]
MPMEAVIIRDLHKSFRLSHNKGGSLKSLATSFRRSTVEEVHALRGVSFTVDAGETLAIIGKNGSGKSTLLGTMTGIYRPTSGDVIMNGRVSSLLDLGAGFHPDLTGLENIYLNASILGISRREIRKRLDAIISFAQLERFIDAPIRTYSNGMVLRLGFAIATQIAPDILLVDEVIAVGDEEFQQKCYAKVREMQQAGKTIIFVSHDLRAVRTVANRVLWLDAGVIRQDDGVAPVLDAYLAHAHEADPHSDS